MRRLDERSMGNGGGAVRCGGKGCGREDVGMSAEDLKVVHH